MKRILLLMALVMTLTVLAALPASASPSAQQGTCPYSWAAKPCRQRWISVVVYRGYGVSAGCVDLGGNPFGYYKKYTLYAGWMYIDAKGVTYYSWFNDAKKGAVVGPLKIVNQQSWIQCGIP